MTTDVGRVPTAPGASRSATGAEQVVSAHAGDAPSRRLAAFRQAQDDARTIASLAARAKPAERAARWFAQYGLNCAGKDAGSASWRPAFAGACEGADDAAEYVGAAITMMLPAIIAEAEALAETDMAKLLAALGRDTDGSPQGRDAQRLDGEAATAGAEGIAPSLSSEPSS